MYYDLEWNDRKRTPKQVVFWTVIRKDLIRTRGKHILSVLHSLLTLPTEITHSINSLEDFSFSFLPTTFAESG